MTEGIIVAIIMSAGTIITQIVISAANRRTGEEARLRSQELIEYRIGELEKKVDEHNNYAKHIPTMETDIGYIKQQLEARA